MKRSVVVAGHLASRLGGSHRIEVVVRYLVRRSALEATNGAMRYDSLINLGSGNVA